MSVVELEEFISYLDRYGDDEQIDDCVREREYRLWHIWRCADVEFEHLKRVNAMVMEKFQQTLREAERLFDHLKEVELPSFFRFTITASVYPKSPERFNAEIADDGSGSDYLTMAQLLSRKAQEEPYIHCFEATMSYDYEKKICSSNYGSGFDENGELCDWSYETALESGMKSLEQIFVSHAMHSLLTHSDYAPQDVIRIEEFESKITVEYEHHW